MYISQRSGDRIIEDGLFAFHINTLLWPKRRMKHRLLVRLDAFEIGKMTLERSADAIDQVFALRCSAISCLDSPSTCFRIKLAADDFAVEGDVLFEIEHLHYMLEIPPKFRPGWKAFSPAVNASVVPCIDHLAELTSRSSKFLVESIGRRVFPHPCMTSVSRLSRQRRLSYTLAPGSI